MCAGGDLRSYVGLLGSAALSPEGFEESVVLVSLLVALVRGWYTVLRRGVGCMLVMRLMVRVSCVSCNLGCPVVEAV